jgi:polysaccharide export outer membrane protein
MTAVDAIALAGGFTDIAAGNGTKVIRTRGNKKEVRQVPVESILKGGSSSQDVLLEPNDTVVVPESFF